jgi:hypothetical protein
LQVNGGAAIGYSASTAAPTNGLAVAGNIALNSTLSGWISPFNVIEGNTYAGYVGFQTNAADMKVGINNFYDGTGTSGYKYKTTNGAVQLGLSAANGFQVNVVTSGTANTNFVWTQAMLINLSGEVKLTPAANTSVLSTTGAYSLTGSNAQSLIDLAGTWNTTGNPTAIKLNITNTASGTGADLMELQVGGVNQFIVGKSGSGYFKDMLTVEPQTANTSAIKTDGYSLTGSNAQSLLAMTGTWNTTGNPTAIKLDITNTASGSSSYLMDLLVGGTTQFRVAKDGAIRTTAPTGGTADNWKFGTKVASSVVFDDNDYLEVEVGGTLYRVALVNLAEPEPEAIPASTPEDRRINLPAKTSSQRIQELENEIQELKQMIKFLMPTSKNKK